MRGLIRRRFLKVVLVAVGAFVTWCVTPIWQFSSGIETTHAAIAIVLAAVWIGLFAGIIGINRLAIVILGVSAAVLFLGAIGAFDFWLGLASIATMSAAVAIGVVQERPRTA